ncbi:MAG: hypothetical protein ACXAD7_23675, partial [Candidatus Kariarchaeaceae archaeon]
MKFEIVGKEKEKVTITMSPLDLARSDIFEMLELLLEKIKVERYEIYHSFISLVSNTLDKLITKESLKIENSRLREEISTYNQLNDHYEFVKIHLNFFTETLNIHEDELWKNEKISFPDKNFIQSVCTLFYTHLASLVKILEKENAVKFYKAHIDNFNHTINARNQKDRYNNLEDLREQQINW